MRNSEEFSKCFFSLSAWPERYVDVKRMLDVERRHIPRLGTADVYRALYGDHEDSQILPIETLRDACREAHGLDPNSPDSYHALLQLAGHYLIEDKEVATVFDYDFGPVISLARQRWLLERWVMSTPYKHRDPALLRDIFGQ